MAISVAVAVGDAGRSADRGAETELAAIKVGAGTAEGATWDRWSPASTASACSVTSISA